MLLKSSLQLKAKELKVFTNLLELQTNILLKTFIYSYLEILNQLILLMLID